MRSFFHAQHTHNTNAHNQDALAPPHDYRAVDVSLAKEAILSYRLEKALSKDEILSIYLNEIYLGSGAYGVRAAAMM